MITLDRTAVERIVRESLRARLPSPSERGVGGEGAVLPSPLGGKGLGVRGSAPKLVVNVSARHCHVTQEDLERLFGNPRPVPRS
jgi:hypothetical protein